MDLTQIIDELRERLRQEEIKTQNYIQGYSDAIGEAMYIIEKQIKRYEKAQDCQQLN
jgi:hypothetical protein